MGQAGEMVGEGRRGLGREKSGWGGGIIGAWEAVGVGRSGSDGVHHILSPSATASPSPSIKFVLARSLASLHALLGEWELVSASFILGRHCVCFGTASVR